MSIHVLPVVRPFDHFRERCLKRNKSNNNIIPKKKNNNNNANINLRFRSVILQCLDRKQNRGYQSLILNKKKINDISKEKLIISNQFKYNSIRSIERLVLFRQILYLFSKKTKMPSFDFLGQFPFILNLCALKIQYR